MGGGSYSASHYAAHTASKIAAGTTFSYDHTARATGRYTAHESVDPKKLNAAGKNVREAFDNPDNPNTTPLVVAFDSTGSMRNTPRIVQRKLTTLFGLLVRKGYLDSPAVSVATYGDAYCDRVPLQISQFEANNAIDDALDNLILEGGGGGNGYETATLLWYYMNNHVVTDAWNKRGKKGYFFMIADEIAGPLRPEHISEFIGDEAPKTADLTAEAIAKQLQEKWEVFVLLVDNSAAAMQGSHKFYGNLFGANNVIVIENDENVSELIGALVGKLENDDLDDDELVDDLVAVGASREAADKTAKALAKVGGTRVGGSVAVTGLDVPLGAEEVTFS